MTRAFTSIGLVVLWGGAVFGQTGITASGSSAPVFEAADVHVSNPVASSKYGATSTSPLAAADRLPAPIIRSQSLETVSLGVLKRVPG